MYLGTYSQRLQLLLHEYGLNEQISKEEMINYLCDAMNIPLHLSNEDKITALDTLNIIIPDNEGENDV